MIVKKSLAGILFLTAISCAAEMRETEAVDAFILKMNTKHQFDRKELEQLFQSIEFKDKIITAMDSPAEGLPWYKYRKIFITDARIMGGIKFWQENEQTLSKVEQQYGVPAEIIVAIIGVETRYGKHTGHHRVIDALATLGFGYPKRSQFFLRELENFLLLCREEQISPLQPTGSYAGAMGIPQFMPSSFRAYAADFDGDERRDIWNNPADVIASVANYFVIHKWQTDAAIAFPVQAQGKMYLNAINKNLKPDMTLGKLQSLHIQAPENLDIGTKVKLFVFEQENHDDLWIALTNFYVITRYNHSPLYAMAVFQLSQAILKEKENN